MINLNKITDKIKQIGTDISLYHLETWIATEIATNALEKKEVLYIRKKRGFLKIPKKDFVDSLTEGSRKIFESSKSRSMFITDTALIFIESLGEDGIYCELLTTNIDEVKAFEDLTEKNLEKSKRNIVSVLASSPEGLHLTTVGTLNEPLIRENYTKEVLSGFDFVVKDLQAKEPFGRLVIINGSPGTGKTFMIRGLINELANNTIVLIPPSMIAEIDSPSLIPLFISHKEEDNNTPLTLIIEDADTCLAERMNDNISSISSLLNHTDGILGSLLNLRVIATTNQNNIEFDSALTRAGRLSRHIEVKALNREKATEVYRSITKDKDFEYNKEIILADIYADVREAGFLLPKSEDLDPNFDPNPGKKLRNVSHKMGFR